jgi:hypothetical protein
MLETVQHCTHRKICRYFSADFDAAVVEEVVDDTTWVLAILGEIMADWKHQISIAISLLAAQWLSRQS